MVFVPRSAALGGILLAVTMASAVVVHLTRIGGNPALAVLLLVLSAAIAWLRKDQPGALLGRPTAAPTHPI